ncbi:toxin-antitoxin system YwqK family antitoxin [Wohlfahrtiimonas chitiniclastica]|uniref:toxin-antitoxin system YwqK family antitoxin n=1 Tax=Wohlfahrtiimonas chitiniclastica TaxID=400946 RepID=UPI0021582868|nr:hypothetical protein [Wohlfahrtiimonas chitiniclastica]MDC7252874.1 hypothetical protein [Wohlfahrtiimonas chitiniclastica]
MTYKKTALSIASLLILGTFSYAQQTPTELEPNGIIAYFAEDGTLLPSREGSEYYRHFKDVVSGCYLVQDFYSQNDQKQTDPICFMDPGELQSWFPQSLYGPLTFWHKDGTKAQSGYSQQDGGGNGTWTTWDQDGNASDYELQNGELIVSYFDENGNRQPNAVDGGTFRTILSYDESSDSFLVADYFTDTRTRQMDPVVIAREDLLRWNIENREGTYVYYNEAQEITAQEEYAQGKLNGTVTFWYQDTGLPAQKMEEINFKDGQQEGLYVSWYPNGYPQYRINFTDMGIDSVACWDENFVAGTEDECMARLTGAAEAAEVEANANDEINDDLDVEIIIPSDQVVTPTVEDQSDLEDAITPDATVLFPHDEDNRVLIDDADEAFEPAIEATETTPALTDEEEAADIEAVEEADDVQIPNQPEPETEGKRILRSLNNILEAL